MTGNGYIEIQIEGKTIGLRFNMYGIEQFDTVKGNNSYSKNLTTIVYAGLLGNCFAMQKEPEISFAEVNEWVESQIFEGDKDGTLNAVADTFLKSNAYARLTGKANGKPEDTKKKEDSSPVDYAAVHAFVFGEIGLLPRDYYMLLPHELNAMAEGYHNRQYKLSCEKRHAAFIGILPYTKDVTLDKFCREFWPLAGDKIKQAEPERLIVDAELWGKILERHKKK